MIRGFGIASNRFDARYELEGCVLPVQVLASVN
jgi:hypothetical protein